MNQIIKYAYILFCYFFTTIIMLYFVGFYQNFYVPKQISSNIETGISGIDVIQNFSLILLFGLQHSIMARSWFKKWWSNIIPASLERVTYLLFSSIILGIIIMYWQPINIIIWDIRGSVVAIFLRGISVLGLIIIVVSVLSLSSADFIGWQQFKSAAEATETFQTPLLYKVVRHPIYFGFLLSIWSSAHMTLGHLFFAILISAYIYVGAALEERNLVERFGVKYKLYQQEVAMLIPFVKFPL